MHVLPKIGGSRCVTYFTGIPRSVSKCDRGGSQNWSKTESRILWTVPNKPHIAFPFNAVISSFTFYTTAQTVIDGYADAGHTNRDSKLRDYRSKGIHLILFF